MNLSKYLTSPVVAGAVLFAIALGYYANAALTFPTLFNLDNHLNHAATRYIAEHHRLPVVSAESAESAKSPDIVFSEVGTTRSLRPPLTFILSAFVGNLSADLLDSHISGQRLASSLLGALTVLLIFTGFQITFQHTGLALFSAIAIGLIPKFVFLASCNNDDIGAIFSTSLLFTSVLALIRYKHQTWVLVAFAFSFGMVLQTKFTAWLALPWLTVFAFMLLKPYLSSVLRMLPQLVIVAILAGGWWLIFNMINYGVTDPTALGHANDLQRILHHVEPNQQGYASFGVGALDLLSNHDQFLSKSYKSLVGYLEWLELEVGLAVYLFYAILFITGLFGSVVYSRQFSRKNHYLDVIVLLMIISQCAFYLHHNLVRDIQPQARYLMPMIMPLMYLVIRVLSKMPEKLMLLQFAGRQFGFRSIVAFGLSTMCVILHVVSMRVYVTPSYTAMPFHTALTSPKKIDIQHDLKIVSSSGITYRHTDAGLELQRTGNGQPTLVIDTAFCELLPINSLLSFNVTSLAKGGMHLRLDREHKNLFKNVVWRGFSAGQSEVLFSIDSQGCSGVKLTLAKHTNRLTLNSLKISGLRVHYHGKPIAL